MRRVGEELRFAEWNQDAHEATLDYRLKTTGRGPPFRQVHHPARLVGAYWGHEQRQQQAEDHRNQTRCARSHGSLPLFAERVGSYRR